MSKEMYIQEIEKIAKAKRTKEEEKSINTALISGGAGAGLAGANIAKSELGTGSIDGIVRRYHNTRKKNVESILNEGILSSKATNPDFNELTRQINIPEKEMEGLTYLAKKRSLAESAGMARARGPQPIVGPETIKDHIKTNKTLKINIPLEEYSKMKKVKNPELRGAKDWKEFKKNFLFMDDLTAQSMFDGLNNQTDTVKGDIASKFVKGGKGYKRQTLGGIKKHIKSNPAIFRKGLKKFVPGIGLGLGGAAIAGKGIKNMMDDRK